MTQQDAILAATRARRAALRRLGALLALLSACAAWILANFLQGDALSCAQGDALSCAQAAALTIGAMSVAQAAALTIGAMSVARAYGLEHGKEARR